MSYADLQKALSLAPDCKFYTTVGGKSETDIAKSEQLLNIKFSNQCLEFYRKCGYLSFFGTEIYGINPNDLETLAGNSVAFALNDRVAYNLPSEWLPIYDFGDGSMAYLDYSFLNNDNEPSVIASFFDGEEYVVAEQIAEDLGSFILNLVEEQLKDIKTEKLNDEPKKRKFSLLDKLIKKK